MTERTPPTGFLASAPLVAFEADADSHAIRWIGPQVEKLLGIRLDELERDAFWGRVIVPDDQETVRAARRRSAVSGEYAVDFRAEHADGRVVWLHETGTLSDNGEGTPVIRAYLIDVSDRKRQEVALWKSEERFRALLRQAPDALILTDRFGAILNLNDQAELLFGYSLSEVAGSSIEHLVPRQLRSRLTELRDAFERDPERRTLIDGHGFAVEDRYGMLTSVALSMSLVRGRDGTSEILHSLRDLTAQQRAQTQRQRRARSGEAESVAEAMPAMVAAATTDHRYRFVNEAYAQWCGWERRQIEGRSVREVLGESLFGVLKQPISHALSGAPIHFREELTAPSGASFPAQVSVVPQFDDSGSVHGYYLVIFDATREVEAGEEERRQRAELAHAGRIATLGELAASLAHELNQPLSAIVTNARAASRLLDRPDPDLIEARAALTDISSDGKRAGDVIASMRQLLEQGVSKREAFDIPEVIADVFRLLNSEAISRRVRLAMGSVPDSALTVLGDANQVRQVLLNLVMNAIEATSSGDASGSVRVDVTATGAQVEVAVVDDGPGLGSDDPETLFAPFLSRRTGGLGMGLAISRTIAEAHGGTLAGEDGAEEGAVFRMRLPLSSTETSAAVDG